MFDRTVAVTYNLPIACEPYRTRPLTEDDYNHLFVIAAEVYLCVSYDSHKFLVCLNDGCLWSTDPDIPTSAVRIERGTTVSITVE